MRRHHEQEELVNRRSAIAVAGGLTGALVSGVAGYSVRVHQPPLSAAEPAGKPIVKTRVRTITIHKKAKHKAVAFAAPPVQTVVVHQAPTVVHPAPVPPPVVHHTGGSGHAPGGEGDDHEGGGGDD
jgi:hypothetical protein